MKHTHKLIILIGLISMVVSCKPTHLLYVIPASDNFLLRPYSVSYVLPQTRFEVKVYSSRIEKNPGPLAAYSKQYFAQLDAIQRTEVSYEIDSVVLETISYPDSSQIYFVTTDDPNYIFNLETTNRGLIKKFGKGENEEMTEVKTIEKEFSRVENGIINSKPNNRYLLAEYYSKESKSDAAAHLAKDINTMQEDLHLLIIGEGGGQKQLDAESLRIMTQAISEKMNAYLALFTGYTQKTQMVNTFVVVPDRVNGINRRTLFRFSQVYGVTDSKSMEGTLVYMDIESMGITENMNRQSANYKVLMSKNYQQHGLVYRNPETCVVKILNDTGTLLEKTVEVSQLGAINYLPSHMLYQPVQFIFDENTGALLRIKQTGVVEKEKD